ncbi:MAG: TonB-dependent receptor, partial [bacterium]
MAMKAFYILLIAVLCHTQMFAGGSISGQVTLKSDATPLVGANVLLKGTFRGASTDIEGKFRIDDVTAGTYTLIVSLVGHQRETRADVVVEEGNETHADFSLTQVPVATDQVVTTANRREQSLEDVPVSVSVMDAAEIRYRNAYSIEDAVRYIPGVNMTGGQVNIRGSSGYSRGAGSRVLMLLDGVPFITGDTGELIFESIAVGQVDRIEVVKGASSALYGSSALGGVINIITRPIPEVAETYMSTSGGIYSKPTFSQWNWSGRDRYFGSVALGHTFHVADVGVALGLSRQVNDGYLENSHIKRTNVYVKAKKDFASANSLTMNFGLLFQERGQFQYWRNLDSALIPPAVQRDDGVRSLRYFLSGSYNDAFADNFLFTAKVLWNHNDWTNMSGHDFWAPGWDSLPNGRFSETLGSLSNGYRLDVSATWLFNNEHTITFGVGGNYDNVTSASKLFGSHQGWSAAFFAQDEWRLTKELALTFGGRFDVQRVGLTESGPQVNPKVALAYNPTEGTSLRASFGRGFRIPSIAEAFVALDLGGGINALPNTDLKAEQSNSYEVGINQRLSDFANIDLA